MTSGFKGRALQRLRLLAIWAAMSVALASVCYASAGVTYREFHRPEGPWEVQVVELDRGAASFRLGVALAAGHVYGREPIDELVQRVSHRRRRVVAAITGDFFKWDGDPVGLCVLGGELVSTPNSRVALAIFDDGSLAIDRFSFVGAVRTSEGAERQLDGLNQACPVDGMVLLIRSFDEQSHALGSDVQVVAGPMTGPLSLSGTHALTVKATLRGNASVVIGDEDAVLVGRGAAAEFLASFEIGDALSCDMQVDSGDAAIAHAVGGAGHLLKDGAIEISEASGYSAGFAETRHPRTAFGFNDERAFLVTVDGRQPGYSVGMSLVELAELMLDLGAADAINLDGGGSTTMWAEGAIKNRPSDGSPRPLANALVVYQIVHVPHVAPLDE